MNEIFNKTVILLVTILVFSKCAKPQNIIYNQYEIINLVLQEAKKNRDSIYIIDWVSLKSDKANFTLLKFREKRGEIVFNNFKKFLANQNIDIEKELPYFNKQLQESFTLDKNKLRVNEIRIFPYGTDSYKLKYNDNFTNYYFSLTVPIFTKNGKKAIYNLDGSDYANYFIVFTKEGKIWKETGRYNYNKIELD